MNLSNMKVRTRLALGFGALALLMTVSTGVGVTRLQALDADVRRLSQVLASLMRVRSVEPFNPPASP